MTRFENYNSPQGTRSSQGLYHRVLCVPCGEACRHAPESRIEFHMAKERSFRVVLEMPEGRRSIDCGAGEYILNAAAARGINLPFICRQGRCLTCAARLLGGIVEHDHPDSYFADDRAAGFILLCRAMPRSDLRILTHQQWEMRAHRQAHDLPAPYA